MAFLRHDGINTAKGYAVVWLIQQGTAPPLSIRAHYIHKHYIPGKTGVRTLEPGSERLISPFFNISAADYKAHHATSRIPPNFPFLDAHVVSASIDAVIFDDGSLYGQDDYDLRARYIATRNAEHDEAVLFLRELKEQASVPDSLTVDSILEKHFKAGIVAAGTKSSNWRKQFYSRALGQEAAIMRSILSTRGLTSLQADARRRTGYPSTLVNRAAQTDLPSE